jgi:hypothetical protein
MMKLVLGSEHLQTGVSELFPIYSDFITASSDNLPQEIINLIIQHLQSLKNCFRDCFPIPDASNKWVRNPFNVDVKSGKDVNASEENSLVELLCDTSLGSSSIQDTLSDFWLHVKKKGTLIWQPKH